MNIQEIKNYLRTAPMDEVREAGSICNLRIRSERREAKAQFRVGDTVDSDNPRWVYGPSTVTRILRKYIAVETRHGDRYKVPATWLKHV